MTHNMTGTQYVAKFIQLSYSTPDFDANKRVKMRRFEEALPFYIRNQHTG